MNEKELIDRYFKNHTNKSVCVGIGDDAAVLNVSKDHQLVVSTDSMVEGKHFFKTTPPYYLGYKLMAVNLSDIAAMSAVPKWVSLNLTLPFIDESWLNEFSKGFNECAQQFNVALIGGDLTAGTELNVAAQILAEVPKNQAVLRSNAQVGDLIFVTGEIGSAGNVIHHLLVNNYDHSLLDDDQIKTLYQPEPRVALSLDLRTIMTAAIDISDGLLHEAELLCQESHVGAEINIESIPVDKNDDQLKSITVGDDYELLFTADEKFKDKIEHLAQQHMCLISQIGKINKNTGKVELLNHGQPISKPAITGYEHFA